MVAMLTNVKIDSPAGAGMVAGTLDGASTPGSALDDDALVRVIASLAGCLSSLENLEIAPRSLENLEK